MRTTARHSGTPRSGVPPASQGGPGAPGSPGGLGGTGRRGRSGAAGGLGGPGRPGASALSLLTQAHLGLIEAMERQHPPDRYVAAHMAALRAAASVIAARSQPAVPKRRGRGPANAWVLLTEVAPELGEWAAFFAAGASKRASAEAELPGAVTPLEADQLVRDVRTFLSVIETTLGLTPQLGLAVLPPDVEASRKGAAAPCPA